MRTKFHFLAGTLSLTVVKFAVAQSYSVDWHKIAGGGTISTGGAYQVNGTSGQHDAGTAMTGGSFSVIGGFWSFDAVVQTSGAPFLTITRSNNSVIVSWPSPSTSFVLQQSGNLATETNWVNFEGTVNDSGTIKTITTSPQTGNLFFRLSHP